MSGEINTHMDHDPIGDVQESPIMRPDQIGMQLCNELVDEANALKAAYADGKVPDAYSHLYNSVATIAELMKGFGHDKHLMTVSVNIPKPGEVNFKDIDPDDLGIHR